MQRIISQEETEHLASQFRRNFERQFRSASDIRNILVFLRRRLIKLSGRYDQSTLRHICSNFVDIIFELVPLNTGSRSPIIANTMAEVYLAPFERGISGHTKLKTFVLLSEKSFSYWFHEVTNHKIKWLEATVFLAVIIAADRHGGAIKAQIKSYVKIDPSTLLKYLKRLEQRGLIFSTLNTSKESTGLDRKPKELFDYNRPKDQTVIKTVVAPSRDAWFSDIDPLGSFDELDWVPYTPWKPEEIKNPLVQVIASKIEVHERTLEATVLLAALLSRAQLRTWLKASHGSSYRKIFATIKGRINTIVSDMLTIPHIQHLHYRQISHALPVVMYAARRIFPSDPAKTILLAKLTREEIRLAWSDAILAWEALDSITLLRHRSQRQFLYWDFKYFLTCFLKVDPFFHWNKKYPNARPALPLVTNDASGAKLKWIEISEKQFSLASIESISTKVALGADIYRIITLFNNRRILRSLKKKTYLKGSDSPRALTQTLDNASHRMYMLDAPRQGIPKSIRSIFKSRPNHQFLMVDIIQNDLSLWQTLAMGKDNSLKDMCVFSDFTQVSDQLNLSRSSIKQAAYSFFYGASPRRILLESGFSKEEWREVQKGLGLTYFTALKREIVDYVKDQGTTPPTPHLNYRIPMNKKFYRAPSLYVQAIGAEIMREWILNLKEMNLAVHIVNLIHDEIIFELPDHYNLWESAKAIEECLHKAINAVLPLADLQIRASASKRWDEESAIVVMG